jgi:hypothetical protein
MGRFSFVSTASSRVDQILNLLESEMAAHGAYTKVDTVIAPTTNYPCSVWRCAGSQNGLGQDFYILIQRDSAAATYTPFWIAVAEGYNPATKAVIRPAPGTGQALASPAADSSYGGGAEFPIYTSAGARNLVDIGWQAISSTGSTGSAWTVVNRRGIWVWNVASTTYNSVQAGLFESLLPQEPFPLQLSNFASTGASDTYWTRHPTVTTAQPMNWRALGLGASTANWSLLTGVLNNNGDRFFNSRPVAGRRAVRTNQSSALYGDLRGLAYDVLGMAQSSPYPAAGDTLLIGTDTYAYAPLSSTQNPGMWVNTTTP